MFLNVTYLPSTVQEKEQMEKNQNLLQFIDEIKIMEQNDFNSLKEEIIDTKFSNQIINEPEINSNVTSEVEIKGPSSLIKQFENNAELKNNILIL